MTRFLRFLTDRYGLFRTWPSFAGSVRGPCSGRS